MAKIVAVKGAVDGTNPTVQKFANELRDAVRWACRAIAVEISSAPDTVFGVEQKIVKGSMTTGGMGASQFSDIVDAPHANAYARHFLAEKAYKTTIMDMGNLVEQKARALFRDWSSFKEGADYLYQQSTAAKPVFPINYVGSDSTARPDFRMELYSSTFNYREAIFDITTPGQVGHLITKKVNGKTLDTFDDIPIAVEVTWEKDDFLLDD